MPTIFILLFILVLLIYFIDKRTPPKIHANAFGGDTSTTCVDIINRYRQQKNLSKLGYATSAQTDIANKCAANDDAKGYHNSFQSGMASGARGQCECKGMSTLEQCIKAYYDEGPGGGHYDIIMNPSAYKTVACGASGKMLTHNFYP